LPWLVFVVLIALWQAASSAGLLPALFMPSPAAVVRALIELWVNGTLVENINASLKRLIPGWIIGTAAGLAAGLAMGIFSAARAAGLPIVSALFPIPRSRCCRCSSCGWVSASPPRSPPSRSACSSRR